jgi:FtsP/CotA-like multicopper oxidase with cupredoxin domain
VCPPALLNYEALFVRWLRSLAFLVVALGLFPCAALAQSAGTRAKDVCPRPAAGSEISEPEDLRSVNGVLRVTFSYRNFRGANGQMRYCYLYKDGSQAPNLRLHLGDWLILTLKNDLKAFPNAPWGSAGAKNTGTSMSMSSMPVPDPCAAGEMTPLSTNLHFHGLSVPPVCRQDDVLRTLVAPGGTPFEYRFQIPADEPPGLYWYHPHVHGFSNAQVQGGASGALIVEGVERVNTVLAGLPERVLIIRDQQLLNPDAAPLKSTVDAPVLRDAEGDVLNTGSGLGKPAKDLSVNFVPVPFPNYPPALISMKPNERQLWRVLNASAITYLDLQILLGGAPQPMGVVGLDGVPINEDGMAANRIIWQSHVLMPPGGRIEFVFKGVAAGARATLITRSVDTGPAGENDPVRPLADIISRADAPEPRSTLATSEARSGVQESSAQQVARQKDAWLGDVKPVRERKLYFSEKPSDPNDPNSPTIFMLTVDGQDEAPYDMHSTTPNITVRQGDVEDWIIENRSQELHAFHIHQIHFLLREWNGVPVDEPFLRDTVNVPYWDGKSTAFPSVKLRMDFRDSNTIGTFVYHCHLLEHEDGGMMGIIRVEARNQAQPRHSRGAAPPPSAKLPSANRSRPTSSSLLRSSPSHALLCLLPKHSPA